MSIEREIDNFMQRLEYLVQEEAAEVAYNIVRWGMDVDDAIDDYKEEMEDIVDAAEDGIEDIKREISLELTGMNDRIEDARSDVLEEEGDN